VKILTNKMDWNIVPKGLTCMFFGPPKTHKTTEASKWSSKGSEGVLVIDTELGADYVEGVNRIVCTELNEPTRPVFKDGKQALDNKGMPMFETTPPEERGYVYSTGTDIGKPMPVYSFAEIVSYIVEQISLGTFAYETVVIDTIDEVNDWVERAVCDELEIKAMGEGNYGADWALSRNKTSNVLTLLKNTLKKAGVTLILISHSKTTTIVKDKVQLGPDLPKGLAKKIMGMCELIGYVSIDERTHDAYINFSGFDEIQMGSRLKPLSGQKIKFGYEYFVSKITSYTD